MNNLLEKAQRGPSFASLFSGCGGLDYGFVKAGFRCLAAFDFDETALATHRKAIDSITVRHDLNSEQLPCELPEHPDILLAGPPCQGFSTIGKRRLDDERNHLLTISAKLAVKLKPEIFILENVPGARSGEHKKYWTEIETILSAAGFQCTTITLKATDFGVPQLRKRLFLIASRRGIKIKFPERRLLKTKTLRDAIGDIECHTKLPNHEPILLQPNTRIARIARRIGAGKKLCNVRTSENCVHTWQIPEVFGRTTSGEREVLQALIRLRRRERLRNFGDADPVLISRVSQHLQRSSRDDILSLLRKGYLRRLGHRIDLRHVFNGKFRRIAWDQASFTVDTRFGDPRNFLHPEENRSFTVREVARIQGFPDTFTFFGSTSDQFRLLGNAVPPPLSNGLAVEISSALAQAKR